eukprot:gene6753-2631_t
MPSALRLSGFLVVHMAAAPRPSAKLDHDDHDQPRPTTPAGSRGPPQTWKNSRALSAILDHDCPRPGPLPPTWTTTDDAQAPSAELDHDRPRHLVLHIAVFSNDRHYTRLHPPVYGGHMFVSSFV